MMSDLTIPNEVTEIEYTVGSTSSNGPFTIPFSFFADGDVKVSVNDGTTTTLLTLINDYSVAGVAADGGFDGGSVTLVASISNSTIKIYRDIIIDRTSNFPSTGPFNIDALNTELNKAIAIMQELRTQKDSFLFVPAENISTDPFDANGRAIDNIGELSDDDAAATNRQVKAAGPSGVNDDNLESGALTINQWNTVISLTSIEIQGAVTATTKLFDLITEYFCFMQNRGSLEAEFYFRYRYIVECYSEVAKQSNANYRIKIPPTSMIPVPFMDVSRAVDYWNGLGTVDIFIDIYPLGSAANNLYTQWNNLAVTTKAP
jgi:hypothetical protein